MDTGTLVFAVHLLIVDTYLCTYRYSLIAKIKVIILCLRERFIILRSISRWWNDCMDAQIRFFNFLHSI